VWVSPYVFYRSACSSKRKTAGRDAPPCYSFGSIFCIRRKRGGAAMSYPCVLFRSACCNSKNMGGRDAPPCVFYRVFAAWGAKHPLTSFVWRWFRLSFCTPFLALHSSARNHATRFSMFFSSSKRLKNHSIVSSAPLFWAHILNCRHTIGH